MVFNVTLLLALRQDDYRERESARASIHPPSVKDMHTRLNPHPLSPSDARTEHSAETKTVGYISSTRTPQASTLHPGYFTPGSQRTLVPAPVQSQADTSSQYSTSRILHTRVTAYSSTSTSTISSRHLKPYQHQYNLKQTPQASTLHPGYFTPGSQRTLVPAPVQSQADTSSQYSTSRILHTGVTAYSSTSTSTISSRHLKPTTDVKHVSTDNKLSLTLRSRRIWVCAGCLLSGATIVVKCVGMRWSRYGSLTQTSTWRLGSGPAGESVYVPIWELLPMVSPDDLALDGWDISGADLATAMSRAQVLDWGLQQQLKPHMEQFKPRPSVFDPDFIAANQNTRADNVLSGSKWEQVEQLRRDIRDFKTSRSLDKVIVVWTASTERFTETVTGLNDTADHLMAAIRAGATEVAPSTLFAVAAILEGSTYINGSPQNTFVNGCVELAEKNGVFIAGDDFKSGQTKLKSVLVDFLVSAGIKPVSIVSYNHLGNNDGRNLSSWKQFRSKEISKSNVVDDMVESNKILFKPGETPDHCVVIKYVPYVGDSKRAMDEYTSEILMGGHNTLVIHNTCEDSLLASPIILDLVLLAELCSRITFKQLDQPGSQHYGFNSVLSILSYFCKAPLVPSGEPVVNALSKQRACLENVLRACLGLQPEHSMLLEHKLANPLMFEPKQPAWTQ
uniref:inositol-3-phosphate synthase n=1 Tax=Timema genevievae TaxID=629358 RepID=A0A7R9K6K7_TIMGE|nr:unnamed protein product [Timema genevievae]